MLMNLSVRDKSIQKIAYKKLKSYTKKRIYNIVKGGKMKYKLKKLPVIETRTCQRCRAEFDITARQKRKLYCDNCRKINKIEKQKLYENKPEIQVKRQEYGKKYRKENYEPKRHSVICDRCGRYFIMGSGVSKTCIECLKKSKSYDERFRADCRRIY